MAVYKGWNAHLYKDNILIGYADSASVEISSNVEAYFDIGHRQAQAIVEGNEEITGSFSKAWIDKNYLSLVSPGETTLTEFDLCFAAGTGPDVYVYAYDCKFDKGSLDIPQDGILKESYDFKAKTVSIV